MHTSPAHSMHASPHAHHAYKSPTQIKHTSPPLTSRIQVPHTHHDIQVPHTHHAYKSPTQMRAYKSYTRIMHTSPPHRSSIKVPHTHAYKSPTHCAYKSPIHKQQTQKAPDNTHTFTHRTHAPRMLSLSVCT